MKPRVWMLLGLTLLAGCTPPPPPARLTLSLEGIAEAPVQVVKGSLTAFSGTLKGSATLALEPGTYRVDGQAVAGFKAPDPQEVRLGGGEEKTIVLTYTKPPANPAHLTLTLEGVAEAPVLVSQGTTTAFSGAIQGSKTLDLEAGTYTVDGQAVSGFNDPQAQDVALAAGETKTLTLTYTPGPPPPPPAGITLLAPGATIGEPRFEISVKVDDPGQYNQMDALFADKGILTSWSVVPNKTLYSAQVTLNPDQYNGPHTLSIRARKLDGKWVDGPAKTVTMQVNWNGAAYVEFLGFPATAVLEIDPSQDNSLTLNGLLKSRNGWNDPLTLSATAPAGVTVTLNPAQLTLGGAEEKPLTVTLTVSKSATSGTYPLQITAKDQWDLRHSLFDFSLKASRRPVVNLALPADPLTARPVKLTANVTDENMGRVDFYLDGKLVRSDDQSPYDWSWDPGLGQNGNHTFKAVATDTLGFVGESLTVSRALKIPFGIRGTLDLGAAPTAGPLLQGSALYLGAGSKLVRIDPAGLATSSYTFAGETLKALAGKPDGRVYAATDAKVYQAEADLSAASPVWAAAGGFVALEPGYAAYGSVVHALEGGWERDVGEPIRALAVSGNDVYLATDTRLLHYPAGGGAPQEFSPRPGGARGLALTQGYLWVLNPVNLERFPLDLTPYPLAQNPVADPEALDGAAWEPTEVNVAPNAAVAPDGRSVAEWVTVTNAAHSLRQVVTVEPEKSYTFSFWAKNNDSSSGSYSVYDVTNGADLIAPTPYPSAKNAWSQIIAKFTAAAGTTQVALYPLRDSGEGVNLFLWGVRLDPGDKPPPFQAPQSAAALCGSPTGMRLLNKQTDLWISDAGGCLTRVSGGQASQFAGMLAFPPSEDGLKLYLGKSDGTLLAIDGAGTLLRQEKPVAETPALGIAVLDHLFVPYGTGKLRVLDKLP